MIIPIDKVHRITSDRHQWILQESSKVKGETRWTSVSYYPCLDGMIRHVFDLKLRLSDADTLIECIREAESLNNMLSHALACINTPNQKPPFATEADN